MSNMNRIMTIRVIITDPEAADWLWNSHKKSNNGVKITAIQEGDLFADRDMLSDAACFYIREEGETTEEAIEACCAEPFNDPNDAASEAPSNVTKGAAWDIVDVRGNVVRSSK